MHNDFDKKQLSEQMRLYIFARDNSICQLFGCPGQVIHHIIPRSKERHNDKLKLITLCNSCHEKIHREGTQLYKEYLLDRAQSNEVAYNED